MKHKEDVEMALVFAKLEIFEFEHGTRELHHCPGIKRLTELMPESERLALEESKQ